MTRGWLVNIVDGTAAIRANAAQLTMPILLLQAEQDQIIPADAQRAVCAGARNCTLRVVAGAQHEAIFENDDRRAFFLNEATGFLQSFLR